MTKKGHYAQYIYLATIMLKIMPA